MTPVLVTALLLMLVALAAAFREEVEWARLKEVVEAMRHRNSGPDENPHST